MVFIKLLDGSWGVLRGSWGVLGCGTCYEPTGSKPSGYESSYRPCDTWAGLSTSPHIIQILQTLESPQTDNPKGPSTNAMRTMGSHIGND